MVGTPGSLFVVAKPSSGALQCILRESTTADKSLRSPDCHQLFIGRSLVCHGAMPDLEVTRLRMRGSDDSGALRIAMVSETYPPEINGVAMTVSQLVGQLSTRGHHIELTAQPVEPAERHGAAGLLCLPKSLVY
jgi:hypothetical protein